MPSSTSFEAAARFWASAGAEDLGPGCALPIPGTGRINVATMTPAQSTTGDSSEAIGPPGGEHSRAVEIKLDGVASRDLVGPDVRRGRSQVSVDVTLGDPGQARRRIGPAQRGR